MYVYDYYTVRVKKSYQYRFSVFMSTVLPFPFRFPHCSVLPFRFTVPFTVLLFRSLFYCSVHCFTRQKKLPISFTVSPFSCQPFYRSRFVFRIVPFYRSVHRFTVPFTVLPLHFDVLPFHVQTIERAGEFLSM